MSVRVVVASGNAHKVAELSAMFAAALGPDACEVVGLPACAERYGAAPEIDETADDFEGNAVLKAEGIAAWLRGAGEPGATRVLADDSGVCVDALDGAPGVYSARFCGHHGSDADNNAKLVAELNARGVEHSAAHYACVLSLCRVDGRSLPGGASIRSFEGRWDVVAKTVARGQGGFGYDPHCWLTDRDATVAELSEADKAALSHRGAAFGALTTWWRGR